VLFAVFLGSGDGLVDEVGNGEVMVVTHFAEPALVFFGQSESGHRSQIVMERVILALNGSKWII